MNERVAGAGLTTHAAVDIRLFDGATTEKTASTSLS